MERVRDVSELPKAHLHLHFTGSMRPATVLELADKYGVRLPEALTEALTSGEPPKLRATDERGWFRFQRLYDAARSCLREPEGAFYAYPSVKGLIGKEIRGKRPADTVELAALILEEAEVAVVPGEAFGTPGYLRLSYALGDEDLVEGVSRIQKLLAEAQD